MGPDVDCPNCGNYKIRPSVSQCEVCETAEKYEKRIEELTIERDEARMQLEQPERYDAIATKMLRLHELVSRRLMSDEQAAELVRRIDELVDAAVARTKTSYEEELGFRPLGPHMKEAEKHLDDARAALAVAIVEAVRR